MIKVSIIVPIYNVEYYLDSCLSSLVNQTLEEIEIIAVNDGSTDKSREILNKYVKKYKSIKVIHQENGGVSKARNSGLKVATGEYIGFIDGDDYADTSMFEKMYYFAKDNKLDIAVCNYYKKYVDGKEISQSTGDFEITSIADNPLLMAIINMGIWNKIFKKELFNKVEFPSIKYEDFAILPGILMNANRIGKLNENFVYYNIRSNGETGVVDKRVYDIFLIMDNINKEFKKRGYIDNYYSEIEYFNISRLIMYALQQRVQRDKLLINDFIDKSYEYLNSNFPNWRRNKYFNERNKLKLLIQKNKALTKIYCNLYRRIKGVAYEKNR